MIYERSRVMPVDGMTSKTRGPTPYGRPTTDSRMCELQRECEGAEARLRAAEAQERQLADGSPD